MARFARSFGPMISLNNASVSANLHLSGTVIVIMNTNINVNEFVSRFSNSCVSDVELMRQAMSNRAKNLSKLPPKMIWLSSLLVINPAEIYMMSFMFNNMQEFVYLITVASLNEIRQILNTLRQRAENQLLHINTIRMQNSEELLDDHPTDSASTLMSNPMMKRTIDELVEFLAMRVETYMEMILRMLVIEKMNANVRMKCSTSTCSSSRRRQWAQAWSSPRAGSRTQVCCRSR